MIILLLITNSIAVIALLLFIRANRSTHKKNQEYMKQADKRYNESIERYENIMKLINLILDKTWNQNLKSEKK